ncbi:MAG TPA: hypothetical protein GXZ48_07310, partial [Acholeplasmataceae bacterium]|nr:hypothetical protein [Acholeplasmataceae bacterium]
MRIKKQYSNYYLSFMLLVFVSFPTTARLAGTVTSILKVMYILAFCWALLVFAKKYYIMKKLYIVFLMLPWFLFCSMLNDGSSVQRCFYMCIRMFSTLVLTQALINFDCKKTIIKISNIWSLYMIIQLVSLLTGFMGVTSSQNTSNLPNFFFGIRVEINEYIVYTIAFVMFAAVIGKKKQKILAVIVIVSGMYFAINQWVSTSISGVFIFFAVFFLFPLIKVKKRWK